MTVGWTLGVDLAGRYSAAILLDPDLAVGAEWSGDFGDAKRHHSVPVSNLLVWLHVVCKDADEITGNLINAAVWVEEVPTRMIDPKIALTQRGALLSYFWTRWDLCPGLVPSGTWQKWIEFDQHGVGGKTSAARKAWAKQWADKEGYQPPVAYKNGYAPTDLITKTKAKEREDLVDAYCIARYGAAHEIAPADFGSAGLSIGRVHRTPI